MNKRNIIVTTIITLIVGVVLVISTINKHYYEDINTYYQVYLNGDKIGLINNERDLYALIDDSQTEIKDKYNVDSVYPPTDLKIIETNTYSSEVADVKDVYEKIEEQDDFAVKGYLISITNEDDNFQFYVLDKEIFYNAAKRFVRAFLAQDEYDKYINSMQEEIVETGRIIENMRFKENIVIKESYVSVNDKIYTDELELAHYLLFGNEPESKSYTVKLGDTIDSISEENKLNVEEFLIANSNFKSADTILKVGETVNVTLIDPQLTFVYTIKERYDEVEYFSKKRVPDKTKNAGWSEITTPGVNGIYRYQEEYTIENGERSQGADPVMIATIREVQDQITTYGTKYDYISGNEQPVILDGDWAWPTNRGYVITSYRGWRWGRMHQGLDISGAGNFGSPIYAAAGGVVTYVYNGCPSRGNGYGDPCGSGMGNSIIITHSNGYQTRYGHLHQTIPVRVGQTVSKGTRIGSMGNSGSSTGVHLHFEVKYNNVNIDPLRIYR